MEVHLNKYPYLKKYFGYTEFRNGQEALIDHILKGQDVLGIMPTGGGKSLCYQLPAILMEGITLVISPLISLMKDQVDSLNEMGIGAVFINSSLEQSEINERVSLVRKGAAKLLYVAPERLNSEWFLGLVESVGISLIAVDEAHCISHWGHDFRPSYQEIPGFIRRLKRRPAVAAFTATATLRVVDEIKSALGLMDPYSLTTGFDRPNLSYRVATPPNKYTYLKAYLSENHGQASGVIYCATRKTVEGLTKKLRMDGFNAEGYHGGMETEVRKQVQNSFKLDTTRIIVATNAFGMGIDKPDVRFVVHYNMPANMEAYYQEAGRAGRDGAPGDCILMYSPSDIINQKLILDNDSLDPSRKAMLFENLHILVNYCHTQECLRRTILEYFGETGASDNCGNCCNCTEDGELTDVTLEAQKIISCIYRVEQRYGLTVVIKVLKGSKDQKLRDNGLDQVSTYGLLAEMPEGSIKEIIMSLISRGYVHMTTDAYPVLKLRPESKRILIGEDKILIKKSRIDISRASKKTKKIKDAASHSDEGLLALLVDLRKTLAAKKRVPTYVIFHNKALEEMAQEYPRSRNEFLEISGVGEKKYESYGAAFAEVIAAYCDKHGCARNTVG